MRDRYVLAAAIILAALIIAFSNRYTPIQSRYILDRWTGTVIQRPAEPGIDPRYFATPRR